MKLIVFSDSHGVNYGMMEAMTLHPNADCYLHLGDGAPEFVSLCQGRGLPWAAVRGNCDFACDLPVELTLNFGGFTFYLTHGHICGAKSSTAGLRSRGREADADVILFGHTHIAHSEYESDSTHPYYLFNPGAVGRSYGAKPSYGVIEIKGKSLLLSHGYL
ncbi:MAG: YfcE family phosphodiesterase [Clostridia bacterium]|nr:YfcE family phosphodiesterase [Clostridia bacterium]